MGEKSPKAPVSKLHPGEDSATRSFPMLGKTWLALYRDPRPREFDLKYPGEEWRWSDMKSQSR